jgi:DNA-binding CsgD family transcriptional regulator
VETPDSLTRWQQVLGTCKVSMVAIYRPMQMVSGADEPRSMQLALQWPERTSYKKHFGILHQARLQSCLSQSGEVMELNRAHELRLLGFVSYTRLSIPVPAYHSIDAYHFYEQAASATTVRQVIAATLEFWSVLRDGVAAHSPLTIKEVSVLAQAFCGKSAKETATVLGLSERNVTAYIQSAMAKLEVTSKLAAVQKAGWLGHF